MMCVCGRRESVIVKRLIHPCMMCVCVCVCSSVRIVKRFIHPDICNFVWRTSWHREGEKKKSFPAGCLMWSYYSAIFRFLICFFCLCSKLREFACFFVQARTRSVRFLKISRAPVARKDQDSKERSKKAVRHVRHKDPVRRHVPAHRDGRALHL